MSRKAKLETFWAYFLSWLIVESRLKLSQKSLKWALKILNSALSTQLGSKIMIWSFGLNLSPGRSWAKKVPNSAFLTQLEPQFLDSNRWVFNRFFDFFTPNSISYRHSNPELLRASTAWKQVLLFIFISNWICGNWKEKKCNNVSFSMMKKVKCNVFSWKFRASLE